jgi:hypothetical protein
MIQAGVDEEAIFLFLNQQPFTINLFWQILSLIHLTISWL